MSSSHVSIHPRQPSSVMTVTNPAEAQPTATKKKFGKNLNSVTKRPQPPASVALCGGAAANGTSSNHPRTNGVTNASASGRNGLLLLSSKRQSVTTSTAGSASLGGGGLLAAPRQVGRSDSTSTAVSEMVGPRTSAHDEMFRKAAGDQATTIGQTQHAWRLSVGRQHDSHPKAHALPGQHSEGNRKEYVVATAHYDEPSVSPTPASGITSRNGLNIHSSRYHYPDSPIDLRTPSDASRPPPQTRLSFDAVDSSNGGAYRRQEGPFPFYSRDEHHQSRHYGEGDHPYVSRGRCAETERDWRATSTFRPDSVPRIRDRPDAYPENGLPAPRKEKAEPVTKTQEFHHNPSDEMDARNEAAEKVVAANAVDEQVEFMSRLARERAEKRRAEEAARLQEQKARVARRLRELDEKKPPVAGVTVNSGLPGSSYGTVSDTFDVASGATDAPTHPSSHRTHPAVASTNEPDKSTRRRRSGPSSEIVLERLGRVNKGGGVSREETSQSPHFVHGSSTARKLFDPNRTYSSLVGGSSHPPANGSKTESEPQSESRDATFLSYGREKLPGSPLLATAHFRRHSDEQAHVAAPRPQQLIQLSSYEDRDRGERSPSAGPRMLFDPKSGSMVAAPTPRGVDDSGGGGKGAGTRKDRGLKSKGRVKGADRAVDTSRNKEENTYVASGRTNSTDEKLSQCEFTDAKGSRRSKGTKVAEDTAPARGRERRRAERGEHSPGNQGERGFDAAAPTSNSANIQSPSARGGFQHPSRNQSTFRQHSKNVASVVERLPRTCGVLYKLDHKGNYVCADGCDADHGYGAHSVPGGRLRNPNAHAAFVERQRKLQKANSVPASSNDGGEGYFHGSGGDGEVNYTQYHAAFANGVFPKTQYVVSHQAVLAHGAESWNTAAYGTPSKEQMRDYENHTVSDLRDVGGRTLEFAAPVKVSRDEPIEILTGDEPPTLHADASPWAPSKAALAAAAAAAAASSSLVSRDALAKDTIHDSASASSDHLVVHMLLNDDAEDDPSDAGNISGVSPSNAGLGFDPAQNMNTVMMSPSVRAEPVDDDDYDDHINLTNLLSESDGDDNDIDEEHQFSSVSPSTQFLSSSTWSTGTAGVAMGALGNWDVLASRGTPNAISRSKASGTGPASFLSLSPLAGENTWGSVGLGTSLVSLSGGGGMASVRESSNGAKHANG